MAEKRKKTSPTKLTAMRLPVELLAWAKLYAKERNTTVTRIIVDHFTDLRARHEGTHVDQI